MTNSDFLVYVVAQTFRKFKATYWYGMVWS